MQRRLFASLFGALLLAASGAASAQNAFTTRPMNVRAGPNRDYPLVAQLGPGAPLEVRGCLSDWSWCDVEFDGDRGWIYSGGLSFVYEGERVPLYSYGPSLGVPIITFSLLPYWSHHYRRRPWYARRDEWAHRHLPPHMRPPGRPHAGPPPVPYREHPGPGRRGRGEEHRRPPMPVPYREHRPMPGRPPMPNAQRPMPGPPGARREQHGSATPPPGRAERRPRGTREQRPSRPPPGAAADPGESRGSIAP